MHWFVSYHYYYVYQILSDGVCLVEWPERLGHFTPQQRLEIHITATNETMRDVTVIGYGDWWRDAITNAAQVMQQTADASVT
jgi:tRNA A37 threonylcarbamoyladenosine biosynthesis protein TsaE